eukprot:m.233774 g.233774  ORF g.233774 m.233774 type:complete len:79 (-) comp54299_c0_seq21:4346-4582(-)
MFTSLYCHLCGGRCVVMSRLSSGSNRLYQSKLTSLDTQAKQALELIQRRKAYHMQSLKNALECETRQIEADRKVCCHH